jgi:hypothetical protein
LNVEAEAVELDFRGGVVSEKEGENMCVKID